MRRIALAFFLFSAVLFPLDGQAGQDDTGEFIVIILGTRNASDVEVIRKNIGTLPYVTLFVPSSSRPKRVEFRGRISGDVDTLVADIKSLAADRYDVNVTGGGARALTIALRKIRDERPER